MTRIAWVAASVIVLTAPAARAQDTDPALVLVAPGYASARAVFGDDAPKGASSRGFSIGVQGRTPRTGTTVLVVEGAFYVNAPDNPYYPEQFAPVCIQAGAQIGRTMYVRPSGGIAFQDGGFAPVVGLAVGRELRLGHGYRIAPEIVARAAGTPGIAGYVVGVQVPIGYESGDKRPRAAALTAWSQAEAARKTRRSWVARHPALVGSLIGFGAGYLIGYLPGDDAVFYDFTAEFNGLVIGGVGAGAGAIAGWAIGR